MTFNKRFSLAHYDRFQGPYSSTFYNMLKNADQTFRDNIHDIYFGKYFNYHYNGKLKRAGNPMGVEACDEQVDYLFKIQDELGVEISLTFNTIEIPHELAFDPYITQQFVEWIGSYYDRGLRSCTISSEHIMRLGWLQDRCPDMRWKSTVNQIVADAQQFVDYAYLGYNSINLDRSLNRNVKELKRVKRAQEYLNLKNPKKRLISILLIAEACIYRCPFKKEHDSVGEVISGDYFRGPADLSCNGWRSLAGFAESPRSGINIIANDAKTFLQYAELADVFKYSGRLTSQVKSPEDIPYMKAVWYLRTNKFSQEISAPENIVFANDFNEIIDNNLGPIHDWIPGWIDIRYTTQDWRTTYKPYTGIWNTEPGKNLEKLLQNCKNQCWDCHECERVFGAQDIDSALQIKKPDYQPMILQRPFDT
jgi:hypothetical protein